MRAVSQPKLKISNVNVTHSAMAGVMPPKIGGSLS